MHHTTSTAPTALSPPSPHPIPLRNNLPATRQGASAFNQELSFDTSSVTSMNWMFQSAVAFNQPLNFDTSRVTSMTGMFQAAVAFNQPLNFDISGVTSMASMFAVHSARALPRTSSRTLSCMLIAPRHRPTAHSFRSTYCPLCDSAEYNLLVGTKQVADQLRMVGECRVRQSLRFG